MIRSATTYPAVVGRLLAEQRKACGRSQAEAAAAAGVTQSTWSKVERGLSGVTVEQLWRVSDSLKLSPSTLLADAELATSRLRDEGVAVQPSTDVDEALAMGLAFVSGAALGALLFRLLAR